MTWWPPGPVAESVSVEGEMSRQRLCRLPDGGLSCGGGESFAFDVNVAQEPIEPSGRPPSGAARVAGDRARAIVI